MHFSGSFSASFNIVYAILHVRYSCKNEFRYSSDSKRLNLTKLTKEPTTTTRANNSTRAKPLKEQATPREPTTTILSGGNIPSWSTISKSLGELLFLALSLLGSFAAFGSFAVVFGSLGSFGPPAHFPVSLLISLAPLPANRGFDAGLAQKSFRAAHYSFALATRTLHASKLSVTLALSLFRSVSRSLSLYEILIALRHTLNERREGPCFVNPPSPDP